MSAESCQSEWLVGHSGRLHGSGNGELYGCFAPGRRLQTWTVADRRIKGRANHRNVEKLFGMSQASYVRKMCIGGDARVRELQ